MLAQNFKTAEELGIEEDLYNALKKVLVRLETNDLVWVEEDDFNKLPNGFNMNALLIQMGKCGTVGCIAGWAAMEMRYNPNEILDKLEYGEALYQLFYPIIIGENCIDYNSITTEQAAQTLRTYLTTSKVDWLHCLVKY